MYQASTISPYTFIYLKHKAHHPIITITNSSNTMIQYDSLLHIDLHEVKSHPTQNLKTNIQLTIYQDLKPLEPRFQNRFLKTT